MGTGRESIVASYQPGDHVHVAGFGKGLVRAVRNNGRYLVEVKGRAMEVLEAQVAPIDEPKRSRKARAAGASMIASGRSADGPTITLDLHGHTVDEAVAALDVCLSDALLAGASEVRVIHGKSGGRVKAAVHRRLQQLSPVRHFRADPHNAGVTIVTL